MVSAQIFIIRRRRDFVFFGAGGGVVADAVVPPQRLRSAKIRSIRFLGAGGGEFSLSGVLSLFDVGFFLGVRTSWSESSFSSSLTVGSLGFSAAFSLSATSCLTFRHSSVECPTLL